jgi:hypothetical protein
MVVLMRRTLKMLLVMHFAAADVDDVATRQSLNMMVVVHQIVVLLLVVVRVRVVAVVHLLWLVVVHAHLTVVPLVVVVQCHLVVVVVVVVGVLVLVLVARHVDVVQFDANVQTTVVAPVLHTTLHVPTPLVNF